MPEFFDTHAHLDFPDFHEDLGEVISRATHAGITRILSIATSLESSRRVIELTERFPGVFAVVGVHPNHVLEAPDDIVRPLAELARHPRVVALGETGLDYYRLEGKTEQEINLIKAKQHSLFQQHLQVASEHGLNCVIHQRSALRETLETIATFRDKVSSVFHCFSGTPQEAVEILDSGSLVSFTGLVTFKNAQVVRDAVAAVPLGRFMLETDCPFLAPVPHRGRRCEPTYVRDLAETIAVVKGCTLEELSAATCTTARAFFPKLR